MENIISKITNLKNSKIAKNGMYLTISRFLRYGLMFIFTAVCARYLNQDEYGLISYNLSQVGIITLLFSLGADTYIVVQLAKDKYGNNTNTLISKNTLNRVVLMIIVTIGILVLNRFMNIYRFDFVATLIYITAIMDSLRTISDGYFQSKENLKLVAILEVMRSVFLLIGVIIARSLDLGVIGVAFAYSISSIIIFLISLYFLFIKYKIRLVPVRLRDSINLIKVTFPFFLNSAMSMISVQLDVIMINAIGGNIETAIYATAKKILDIVLMIPGIISMVLLPKISKGEINKKSSNKIIIYIFAIGAIISGGVFILSKYVIVIAFGAKYIESYSIIKIFCLAFPFIFINAFLSSFLIGNGRQKKVLYINSVGTIANIILNSILIPIYFSKGAAIATVITIFINLIQFYVYYKKENFNYEKEI